MSTNKQECIVSQGVNFIIRNFDECYEDQDNGFTFHVPFILSTDEQSIMLARGSIKSEIDHGANIELIREDLGFITNKNRFVGPKEAVHMAIDRGQVLDLERLHTRWIQWQLVGDKRWLDVRDQWAELRIELQRVGLEPEDLY